MRDCDSLSRRETTKAPPQEKIENSVFVMQQFTHSHTREREALNFVCLGCITFLLAWGLFGLFLSRENNTKKRKKEEEKMAEVPTFKLVLVGDGGTGESFSFLRRFRRREEER